MGKDGIDPEGDYEVDEKQRSRTLTDEGFAKAEDARCSGLFNPRTWPITSQRSQGQGAVREGRELHRPRW